MRIYKYELELLPNQAILMPIGAKILHVGHQGSRIYLWAEVNPEAMPESRYFSVAATGEDLYQMPMTHLGTTITEPYVWHVYEILTKATK